MKSGRTVIFPLYKGKGKKVKCKKYSKIDRTRTTVKFAILLSVG